MRAEVSPDAACADFYLDEQSVRYLYPLITSGIILIAELLDSRRSRLLAHWGRRRIYFREAA